MKNDVNTRIGPRSAALAVGCLVVLAGCQSSPIGFRIGGKGKGDQLRRDHAALKDRALALENENAELKVKLNEAQRASSADPAILESLPRTTDLGFGRLTGIDIKNEEATATIYVVPTDGRGRFVQIAGEMLVSVVFVPEDPESDAGTPLGGARLGPSDIRDAYRSGLGGSSYLVKVPLSGLKLIDKDRVAVSVRFDDALTGVTHRETTTLAVRDRSRALQPGASAVASEND